MSVNFVELAEQAFSFLETRFGFHPASARDPVVKWEKGDFVVSVIFDTSRPLKDKHHSYEVGTIIGIRRRYPDDEPVTFEIGEWARALGMTWDRKKALTAHDNETMTQALSKIAIVLPDAVTALITNPDEILDKLARQQEEEGIRW